MLTRLDHRFYQRDPVIVARALLGQQLVSVVDGIRVAGVIVETEAYLGAKDKAAHTVNGRHTQRNHSMWLSGGHAYVYFTYGMHYCMNVVAGKVDDPVAVLIRAVEPTEGLDVMFDRRGKAKKSNNLCSGPAKLCQAFGIDRALDGVNMINHEHLFIEQLRQRAYPQNRIKAGPRIGVGYAQEWAAKDLRFYIRGSTYISRR